MATGNHSAGSLLLFSSASVQQALLQQYLQTETGRTCQHLDDFDALMQLDYHSVALVLCQLSYGREEQYEQWLDHLMQQEFRGAVGFFDVAAPADLNQLVLWQPVFGCFESDCTPTQLLDGVNRLLQKQCCLPDCLLYRVLQQLRSRPARLGNRKLTRREQEVFRLVQAGNSNLRIADDLQLSEHTVKTHVSSLYRKLGVRNRIELMNLLAE